MRYGLTSMHSTPGAMEPIMGKLSMFALAGALAAGFLINAVSVEAAALPARHHHVAHMHVTHVQRALSAAPSACWKSTDPDKGAQRAGEGYMAPCP